MRGGKLLRFDASSGLDSNLGCASLLVRGHTAHQAEIAASGLTPLEYMLSVMRIRLRNRDCGEMARAVLPTYPEAGPVTGAKTETS